MVTGFSVRRTRARVHCDGAAGKKERRGSGYSNGRRMSHFLTNALTAPRLMTDTGRATESWMRAALLQLAVQILEMNDLFVRCWGFEAFYLSKSAVACEQMRRAFVLGAKEMLFTEKETSRRTRFLAYCMLAHAAEDARRQAAADAPRAADARGAARRPWQAPAAHFGDCDALAIMTAHYTLLACKDGAGPAELRAAVDREGVRATLERCKDGDEYAGFALGQCDCATVLLAHDMAQRPAGVDGETVEEFERAYGSPLKQAVRRGQICHCAFLEVVGAEAMWGALTRVASATLAFDIDIAANRMVGTWRAEPAIMDFAVSGVDADVGLRLHTGAVEQAKVRRDSQVGRMSSLMSGMSGGRAYRKRSCSVLTTSPGRVVRMLRNFGQHATNYA